MEQNDQISLGRRSVLCVQPHDRESAELGSGLTEYDVLLVRSAAEAIRATNASAFDAYVLDYWLPDWTGANLCRHIREIDPHAPICFFSTAEGLDKKARGIRAGAQAYLSVVDGVPALDAKLKTLLGHADSRALRARARLTEIVSKEVERRSQLPIGSDHAQERAIQALERVCRARGRKAFVEVGGTLAMFARWWPHVCGAVVANRRGRKTTTGSP